MDSGNQTSVQLEELDQQIEELEIEKSEIITKLSRLRTLRTELAKQIKISKARSSHQPLEYFETSTFPWSAHVERLLVDKFKIASFRENQKAAINAILSKKDIILLMRTGGGKSLCYQLPTLVENGVTLVVSPLISLIEDQLHALRQLSLEAASIRSTTSNEEKKDIFVYLNKGTGRQIKLLYMTPEFLNKSKRFKSALQQCHKDGRLTRVAIDEVHCCSQWGHDFRPDYKFLSLLKNVFPGVPLLGLTATATNAVLEDVQSMLGIEGCMIMHGNFDRPNLFYRVVEKPSSKDGCINYVTRLMQKKFKEQSGIIYCLTIKETEELSSALRENGLKVRPYHANLDPSLKSKVHEKWLKNDLQAVIATVAFGMGIDKADVRFVIHYSVPKSIENLYQESGRAGRDGLPATNILMYRLEDYFKANGMINSKTELQKLNEILDYCIGVPRCRRKTLAKYFDVENNLSLECVRMCDICKNPCDVLEYNIYPIYHSIIKLLGIAEERKENLTLTKLLDKIVHLKVSVKEKEHLATIIAYLLKLNYLDIYRNYTAYTTYCYVMKGKANPLPNATFIKMPSYKKIGGLKLLSSEDAPLPSSKVIKID